LGSLQNADHATPGVQADRFMSRGFMRGSLNNKVVMFSGAEQAKLEATTGGPVGELQQEVTTAFAQTEVTTKQVETTVQTSETVTTLAEGETALAMLSKSEQIAQARVQGYEGEACNECQNFTLVRNGTCMKCNTCGSTSGCS
jgi:ribonucleoside-diphosphate reductase alpha chain